MTRVISLLMTASLLLFVFGCSDNNNPTGDGDGNNNTGFVDTTYYDANDGVWKSSLDASNHTDAAYFSFSDAGSQATATEWDISFKRTNINLNGGFSSEGGGTVVGAMLDGVNYDDVDINDTTGVAWIEDELNQIVDNWYTYDFVNHIFNLTGNVFTMVDAEADNYIKFTIDSMVGAGAPPSMGTIWISYVYQSTPNSQVLDGDIIKVAIPVNSGWGYFDFSSGQVVTPSNPKTSTGWDLGFYAYSIYQNSGPNGPGKCAAFPAYGEMTKPTDLSSLENHPSGAPLFPDYVKSVFNGSLTEDTEQWYDYDGTTHQITARNRVFLVKTETAVYKMQIQSYYANIEGVPTSGYFSFNWNEL